MDGRGILLHWRNVTPFGIQSSDQFRSDPPPALTSNKYRKDYNEVKEVGEINSTARPQDRTDVARYFAVVVPIHLWSQAVSQASVAQGKSLSQNARAFALLTMAISDAFVSTFETKYHYLFWRPYTAIRAGDTDGNSRTEPDVAWTSFITCALFSGLSVSPRHREQRRAGDCREDLWQRSSGHHTVASEHSGRDPSLHQVLADH